MIIYLLISEKTFNRSINIKNFYIRRVLRIFPLYYFCVFFAFVIYPALKALLGGAPNETAQPIYYLFFLGNIDLVRQAAVPESSILLILWSVAIEEQFYLVIPFLLAVAPVGSYKWIFTGVLILSWIVRWQFIGDDFFLKFHTFASMGNLAIGGLIAVYAFTSKRFVRFFENLNPLIIKAVYLAAIAVFFFRPQIFFLPILRVFDTSIIAALFAVIILEQNFSKNSFFKMRNFPLLSNLGKYTYGLYCLHLIAAQLVLQITSRARINTELWQIFLLEPPLILAVSIVMAYLSYRFYEMPFLKLKSRFGAMDN